MVVVAYLAVGLMAGIFGGTFGVGGGAIMVPAMVLAFGLTQPMAQGTALAVMMLPVFIPAVYRYYIAGNVNVKMAIFIALGFMVGAFLGAHLAQKVSADHLKRGFGVFLIGIGIKMAFFK
jgi:uncharacterized protein